MPRNALTLASWSLMACVAGCQTPAAPDAAAAADAGAAARAWADAFNSCNATGAGALYQPDAVLWGTFARTIISGRAGVQQYFERVCQANPPPKVTLGEQPLVRVYGDTAINSGTYTFNAVVQGQPVAIPARYSFTYRKVSGQWLIADHHSSALPAPPATPPAR